MVNILQRSNYLVFFDDVRVDPYIINWNAGLGLFADNAQASVTIHRAPRMDKWKAYLTQVRIFGENPFTQKFCMIFEGEITNRTWNENRSNSGTITFTIDGFYHWLDIPVPMGITHEDEFSPFQRFIYEAQNINIEAVREFMISRADAVLLDKNIEAIIKSLFEKLTIGYYEASGKDTTFAFAKMEERFKVMVDVLAEFREAGFLDLFTFSRASNIQSFYVYLNDVITQLMFEFYQDRDGSLRIKTPSWAEPVLKAHTIDASLIEKISGMDAWNQEPTRILAVGAESQMLRNGDPQLNQQLTVPVGLYVGNPREPETERYYSQEVNFMMDQFGQSAPMSGEAMKYFSSGDWFNNLSQYTVTSEHRSKNPSRSTHYGIDFNFRYENVYSIGTYGTVYKKGYDSERGNYIIISQNINGKTYNFQYMHFDKASPLKIGDSVAPGAVIGVSGTTGDSTGPHLHFEIWEGEPYAGRDLHPVEFLNTVSVQSDEAVSNAGTPGITTNYGPRISNTTAAAASLSSSTRSSSGVPTVNELLLYGVTDFNPKKVEPWDVFHISAYTATCAGCIGITAGGKNVRDNSKDHRVVAVDKSIIPLGSIIEIDGLGFFTAYDTGGAIKGKRLDLLVRSNSEANAWGRRNMKVRVIRRGKGNGSLVSTMNPGPSFHTLVEGASSAKYSDLPGNLSVPKSGSTAGSVSVASTSVLSRNTYATVDMPYTGFQMSTSWLNRTNEQIKESIKKKTTVKELSYPMSSFQYTIPSYAPAGIKSVLSSNPSGIDGNLLAAIIASTSAWKEVYKANNQIGIAGININYANAILITEDLYDAKTNIECAAEFLSNAMNEFNNKVTFALTAYYLGGFSDLRAAVQAIGSMDFIAIREKSSLNAGAFSFVDSVLNKYLSITSSTNIKGDPHKKLPKNVETEDTEIPEDFGESYRAELSDEERRFKVNMRRVEQSLIRLDTGMTGTMDIANRLIYQYAKYMMQVHRARSHSVSVNLATCLPFLRPGYNVWIEPTRTDIIGYITNLSHYGSFGNGCSTSITAGFVRRPDDYQEIDESVFVGVTRATSETFGETLTNEEMNSLRNKLKNFHKTEVSEMAHNIPLLKEIYGSMNKNNEYSTIWNKEYTKDEVIAKINEIYADAPQVVIDRKTELAEIIRESESFFMSKLLFHKTR